MHFRLLIKYFFIQKLFLLWFYLLNIFTTCLNLCADFGKHCLVGYCKQIFNILNPRIMINKNKMNNSTHLFTQLYSNYTKIVSSTNLLNFPLISDQRIEMWRSLLISIVWWNLDWSGGTASLPNEETHVTSWLPW